VNEGKKHVVFTDRTNIKDTKTIKGTQQLFQVQGEEKVRPDGKYSLNTFKLPCSCDACIENLHDISKCKYLSTRGWKKESVLKKTKMLLTRFIMLFLK